MKVKNKRFFLLILYIFSILFMLFGITFSYFNAKARSENNALDAKSGKLTFSLELSQKYVGHKLIPTADSDIMKAYHNKCVDDYGDGACVAYDIEIINNSAKQDIVGTIDFDIDNIENLSYLVLDEEDNIYQDITKVKESTKDLPLGNNFILESALETGIPTKRNFKLVIWLSDFDYDQDEDKGGTFGASVSYNSIYGQKLSTSLIGTKKGDN